MRRWERGRTIGASRGDIAVSRVIDTIETALEVVDRIVGALDQGGTLTRSHAGTIRGKDLGGVGTAGGGERGGVSERQLVVTGLVRDNGDPVVERHTSGVEATVEGNGAGVQD